MASDEKDEKKQESSESEKQSASSDSPAQEPDNKVSKNSYHSGLTGHFGRAIVDKSETVEKRNEDIVSTYQQLRKKKNFALSAISSTFGDLLGIKSKEEDGEEEKKTEDENKK